MSTSAARMLALGLVLVAVIAVGALARPQLDARSALADAADLPVALASTSIDFYLAMVSDRPDEGGLARVSPDCVPISRWRTGRPIDIAVDLFDDSTLWALESTSDSPQGDARIRRYRRDGTLMVEFPVESTARYLASGRGRTNKPELYVVHMQAGDQSARMEVYSPEGTLQRKWDVPGEPRGVALSKHDQDDRPVYAVSIGLPGHQGTLIRYDYWGRIAWEMGLTAIPAALTDDASDSGAVLIAAVEPDAMDGSGVIVRVSEDAELLYSWDLEEITPIDLSARWVLGYRPGEPMTRVLHEYDYDGKLVAVCDQFPQPSQPTPEGTVSCPEPAAGTEAWRHPAYGPVPGVPAIADDGTVYAATAGGLLYAIDCAGRRKWLFDYRLESPSGFGAQAFEGAPAVDDDGTIFIGDDVVVPNYFFAITPDGKTRWVLMFEHTYSQIDASPALSDDGRVFAASHGWGAGVNSGAVIIVDREGNRLRPTGWAMEEGVGPITNSPALLPDGRAVYVSPRFHEWVLPTGTPPTITPVPPRPTRTPTPIETPSGTLAPPTSGTPATASTPTVVATATETPEPHATVYLPFAAPGAAGGGVLQSLRPAEAQQMLPPPYVTQPVPSRIRIVTGSIEDDAVVDLPGMSDASSPAVQGDAIWFTANANDGAHLLAYRTGNPPRLLVDWNLYAGVAASPVLGSADPDGGSLDVYLLGTDGRLVRLDVSADNGTATERWVRHIGAPAEGAPALGVDGRIYAAAGRQVVAIERDTGEVAWTLSLDSPASGSVNLSPGGLLHVSTESGDVLAIGTGSGGLDPEAAWPALRHDRRNTGSSRSVPSLAVSP